MLLNKRYVSIFDEQKYDTITHRKIISLQEVKWCLQYILVQEYCKLNWNRGQRYDGTRPIYFLMKILNKNVGAAFAFVQDFCWSHKNMRSADCWLSKASDIHQELFDNHVPGCDTSLAFVTPKNLDDEWQ